MNLYLLSLFIHITGISLAAGTTVISFFVNRRFWKYCSAEKAKALTLMELATRFQRFIGIGIGLLILSGIYMVYFTKGAFGQQLWFRIKMVLVVLAIINNVVIQIFVKRVMGRLTAGVSLNSLQQKITAYYLLQLVLFLAIFILGVFKFN
jgi:hypothetical protein